MTTTTGGGVVEGTVTLAFFPCSAVGGCGGTFSGMAGVSLSGLSGAMVGAAPMPYTAVWSPEANNFSAVFTYEEACASLQPNGTPPLVGDAGGTYTVSGGKVVLAGGLVRDATLTGDFTWSRSGTAVRIILTDSAITAGSVTVATNLTLTNAGAGQGAATFMWTNGPGVCGGAQQTNQTAIVAGIALQVA